MDDLRYAVRSVAAARKFAALVILTFGLGIGANTAVFGVLNAVVLRPLPYPDPERLVRIYATPRANGGYLPGPAVVELRAGSASMDVAAVYTYAPQGADLTDLGRPERVRTLPVSANYFSVLAVEPAAGLVFGPAAEQSTEHVAVVSDRIARAYFGSADSAVGRSLTMNGLRHQVVAVMPPAFRDPFEPGIDAWTPANLASGGVNSWNNFYLSAIGRVRAGASIPSAQAEAEVLAARMPWATTGSPKPSMEIRQLQMETVGTTATVLWILLGAVGLLLLIACVNVASLTLVRGASRAAELRIRAALGCPRHRLVRQLVLESVSLALAGGVAGLVFARVVTMLLLGIAPGPLGQTVLPVRDLQVFLFSFVVSLFAGVSFGLIPALSVAPKRLHAVLRASMRGTTPHRGQARVRAALLVCQVAVALVLLIGAGLLQQSFRRLRDAPAGIDAMRVMTFDVHLPDGRYQDASSRAQFHERLTERLTQIPGVVAAGGVSRLPLTGQYHSWGTRRAEETETRFQADQRIVAGRYFEAVAIPLLRGRWFTAGDDENASRRVIVSESVASELFGREDPIGRALRIAGARVEIVGVVGDVSIGARAPVQPTIYHPHTQMAANRNWALSYVVRSSGTVASPAALSAAIHDLDSLLVLHDPRPLEDVIGRAHSHERFALHVIGAFAAVAVALTAVGIFGMLSENVAQRRREMGIRLALGASARTVSWLVIRSAGGLVLAGVVLGLSVAALSTRALRSLLFAVTPTDAAVFATASLAVVVVAIAASWIPVRAASRVDLVRAMTEP